MEAVERRRSGASSKTSKKGGKRAKALTAEEEARRRELVKEKLREKLELEKRALQIVERLLEDSVAEDFLSDCAKFITSANYKDVVEERFITKLCGYPICPNKLGKIPTQQYKISTKTNKVYDITERKCFCSNSCYKASKEYELQISKTPLWLRQHESPQEIKLMKKGDGGRSGEEVMLSEGRLNEEDVENPLATQPEDPQDSQQRYAAGGLSHSDSSDMEQEQDFVSSVVSQRQGPRVHWGNLPKRTDEDEKGKRGKMERRGERNGEEGGKEVERQQSQVVQTEEKMNEDHVTKKSQVCETEVRADDEQLAVTEEKDIPEKSSVEEAAAKMNLCSLSEEEPPPPVDSPAQTQPSSPAPTTTDQDSSNTMTSSQPRLDITQVSMSKRGAAGLRDLLKSHAAAPTADSIRLNLLEGLRRTLRDWATDETLNFLYGPDHSLVSPFAQKDAKKADSGREDEELDEDDLDEVMAEGGRGADGRELQTPSAEAPDYETLKKETQQLELKVREFYKGTWLMPEVTATPEGDKVTVQHQGTRDSALPLVDSQAQHLIQKRITVERLSSCLKNIVGPLHLTLSDVTTDLNNLVRTFRITNTNIIHKTPEWTLIAVVLLHLLSEVSPLVRQALETPASVQYLNTLMEELGLREQDLLSLVQLFKVPTH